MPSSWRWSAGGTGIRTIPPLADGEAKNRAIDGAAAKTPRRAEHAVIGAIREAEDTPCRNLDTALDDDIGDDLLR